MKPDPPAVFGIDEINPYIDAEEKERIKNARNEGVFTPSISTRNQISIPGELGENLSLPNPSS